MAIAKVEILNENERLITSDTGGQSRIELGNPNSPKEEYLAWLKAGGIEVAYIPPASVRNAPIYAEMDSNDRKIIRAITEGDTTRITAHLTKQTALRAKLV